MSGLWKWDISYSCQSISYFLQHSLPYNSWVSMVSVITLLVHLQSFYYRLTFHSLIHNSKGGLAWALPLLYSILSSLQRQCLVLIEFPDVHLRCGAHNSEHLLTISTILVALSPSNAKEIYFLVLFMYVGWGEVFWRIFKTKIKFQPNFGDLCNKQPNFLFFGGIS